MTTVGEEKVLDMQAIPRSVDKYLQAYGIDSASGFWFRKITEDPGGHSRQRFVHALGEMFRRRLLADRSMSYPGENGFSLPLKELKGHPDVAVTLNEAAAFGVLVAKRHTPKTSSLGECRKWYLQPVLSPYFQITVAHTKEPMYVHVEDVREWMERADLVRSRRRRRATSTKKSQRSLFDDV